MAIRLQCLRDGRAHCPTLLKQLVIWVVVEGTHRHRNVLLQLDVHWNVPGWYECSTENKPCKQVRARTSVSWTCLAHGLQCLCVRGACYPSLLKQLVIFVVVEVSTGTVTCCFNDNYKLFGNGQTTCAPYAQTLQTVRRTRS